MAADSITTSLCYQSHVDPSVTSPYAGHAIRQFGPPGLDSKRPSGVDSGAVYAEATMRIVLLAFGSSLAVLWLFTAYEIVRNLRARAAFGYGGLIARICTPACITSAIAVFAGVILLRS
jgi:hypothetical protein